MFKDEEIINKFLDDEVKRMKYRVILRLYCEMLQRQIKCRL